VKKVSINQRHMAIKLWRALSKRMAGMKYCDEDKDPSKTLPNTSEPAFGKDDKRQLQDMRRSGAVEGDVGGGSVEDRSNEMANARQAAVARSSQIMARCTMVCTAFSMS
jgi:hypothetical protein